MVLGILSGQTSLALPGQIASLLVLLLGLIDVAIAGGGLLVITVEFQEILLGDGLAEVLGLLNDFLKLQNGKGISLT